MQSVEIFEVGPRDGLQNEPNLIPLAKKVALIDLLSQAGFRRIEVASFVSPKWVPQMADSDSVMEAITRQPGVRYAALTPNPRGLARAIAARVDEVAIFASASEGFSRANLNASISQSLAQYTTVAATAAQAGLPVRGYVSCVTDCPFDGPTPPGAVAQVAEALHALGCYEISLGDTLGRARPEAVERMLDAVLQVVPATSLAGHFHDTGGQALANVDAAREKGLRVFDTAIGGLGGCPYAPGAAGNLGTEALASHLHAQGVTTGLDMAVLAKAADCARALRSRQDAAKEDG